MEPTKDQHVQVPRMNLTNENHLHHIDPFIYASIKRYMNGKTKIAFPSITTLIQATGVSKNPLLASISRLEAEGYFTIIKEFGKPNQYLFNDYKKFEMFSYDFLDDPNLTCKEKAYLVVSQQYMFKDPDKKTGTISYDSETFANTIGISTKTLRRTELGLTDKGVLTLIPTKQKELMEVNGVMIPKNGLNIYNRVYDFNEFSNLVALKFQQQDERLDAHEQELQELKLQNKELKDKVDNLTKAISKITAENVITL